MKRCLALLLLVLPSMAVADTFTVTTTADTGPGSLRQAIADSNANGATVADEIVFAIPGTGPHVISVASSLPMITGLVTIDGTTQPGWVANTNTPDQGGLNGNLAIELSSSQTTANTIGLLIAAGTTLGTHTVRGIAITRFARAISASGSAGLVVEGCHIGADVSGTNVPSVMAVGLSLAEGGASVVGPVRIGGLLPAQRNLLAGSSGTTGTGVAIIASGFEATGSLLVQGNLIGTDRTGTAARGWRIGVSVAGYSIGQENPAGVVVGGNTPAARNLISGNRETAVGIGSGALSIGPHRVTVQGNWIGTDVGGLAALPNGTTAATHAAILRTQSTSGPFRSLIGGTGPGEGNRIAFNNAVAVRVSGVGVQAEQGTLEVVGNEIRDNAGLGIDLFNIARANDPGDADNGPNRALNWPEIVGGTRLGPGQFELTFRQDTLPANATFPITVRFYRSNLGRNEGAAELGQATVSTAQAQTVLPVALNLPPAQVGAVVYITALAIDAAGNTSEFSDPIDFDQVFRDGFEPPP
jgi:hypothetical protein